MITGRLDKIVQIARQVETTDASAERMSTTSTFATRWACIEPMSGREYKAAIGTNSKVITQIRLRYDAVTATITPGHLVFFGSVVYDVESIINTRSQNRELLLMCQSGVRNNGD